MNWPKQLEESSNWTETAPGFTKIGVVYPDSQPLSGVRFHHIAQPRMLL